MSNLINLEICGGTSINQAAKEALVLALLRVDKVVTFNFNGIPILVTSWDTIESIHQRWIRLNKTFSELYRESPQYKRWLIEQQESLGLQQTKLNLLLKQLPSTKGKEEALINWLGQFADIADNSNLIWDKKDVAEQLTAFGYAANTFLNLPKESYNCRAILAGYLIGQAVDHLNSDMPPHPILRDWCKKYAELY